MRELFSNLSREDLVKMGANFASNHADFVTTAYFMAEKLDQELNPLVSSLYDNWGIAGLALYKGVFAAGLGISYLVGKKNYELSPILSFSHQFTTYSLLFVAANNLGGILLAKYIPQ